MARAGAVPLQCARPRPRGRGRAPKVIALPNPGDTICGEILLERPASSSMGAQVFQPVFAARDLSRDEGLWLTVVDGMFTPTEVDLSAFMAGANGLLQVRHPSLVRVVLVDREEDYCVVGYEDLPGAEPLPDVVLRGDGRRALARIAVEVARGLAYLHRRGLLHGALTPGTVLMWEGTPMLWEYGLAGLCDPTVLGPRARSLGGDVVAPEVLHGAPLTPAIDVFAWGAVVAAVASGELGADAVSALMEGDVDPGRFGLMLGVVRQALSPEPGLRPRDGLHLLELLQRSLAAVDPNTEIEEPARVTGGDDALRELTLRYLGEVQGVGGTPPGRLGAGAVPSLQDPGLGGPVPIVVTPAAAAARRAARASLPSASAWLRPAVPRAADGGAGGLFDRRAPMQELDHGVRKRVVLSGPTPRPRPPDRPPPRPPVPQGVPGVPTAVAGDEDATPPEGHEIAPRGRREPAAPPARRPPAPVRREPEPLPFEADDLPQSERDTAPELEVLELPAAPVADELPPLPEPDEPAPGAAAPRSRPREPFRVPRTPGPHGPPAWLMVTTLAVLCGLVAVAATLAAASARGGFGRLWSTSPSVDAPGSAAGGAGDDGLVADAPPGPCPSGMVEIAAEPQPFCIDRAEYPGLDRPPAIDVDLPHAEQACAARGHALCTVDQWERACRGRAGWRFPYGPRREAGRCRVGDGSAHPGPSGADPHCVTPEGVLDLVGNVAEWTAEGAVMGGSIRSEKTTGCDSRQRLKPKTTLPVVGFRCCAATRGPGEGSDPETAAPAGAAAEGG